MWKKFMLFIIIVFAEVLFASDPIIFQYHDGKAIGKCPVPILSTKDQIYFYDSTGKNIKTVIIEHDDTNVLNSNNFNYICTSSLVKYNSELKLFNKAGQIIWEKIFPSVAAAIRGLTNDGKVLLVQFDYYGSGYAVGCYDVHDREILFLEDSIIDSVSPNVKYWICRRRIDDDSYELYIYNINGKIEYSIKTKDEICETSIGDNGNFLIKTENYSIVYYNKSGKYNSFHYNDYAVYLSGNGEYVLTFPGKNIAFTKLPSEVSTVITPNQLSEYSSKYTLSICGISYFGNIALLKFVLSQDTIGYLFVHIDGHVQSRIVKLENYFAKYYLTPDFVLEDRYIYVANDIKSDINFILIK